MKDESNLALANINGHPVMVDKDICGLIETLNKNGHTTYYSCSSHPKLKEFNGYIMFEYKKETFDMLMEVLDNIGENYNLVLQLNIEIIKHNEAFKANNDRFDLDKALILRFKCMSIAKYKMTLNMFKFIENLVIEKSLIKIFYIGERFAYIENLKNVVEGGTINFDNNKIGTVLKITKDKPTLVFINDHNER